MAPDGDSDSEHAGDAADERPRYRIQEACERTGIPTATLRAWEKRYGIPSPARSESRYRLYDDHDLALLRRMAGFCASGMRPAEAARLAKRVVPDAQPDDDPGVLVDALIEAAGRMDDAAARRALDIAFARRLPAQAYDEVVAPAMRRIGELWSSGSLSVAHEHVVSAVVRERLADRLRETRPEGAAETAVLACPGDEEHDLGLFGLALHVAAWGVRPVFLGARVPPEALGVAVAQLRPRFVALSLVSRLPVARARKLLAECAAAVGPVRWLVGGPGVASIAEIARSQGAHVAFDLEDARRAVFG
jgi:DNA-binding transcriptional MerR regulator